MFTMAGFSNYKIYNNTVISFFFLRIRRAIVNGIIIFYIYFDKVMPTQNQKSAIEIGKFFQYDKNPFKQSR